MSTSNLFSNLGSAGGTTPESGTEAPKESSEAPKTAVQGQAPNAPAAPAKAPAPEPEEEDEKEPTELDMLKGRAKMMGIAFSPNIGVDALKAKIAEKLAGEETPKQADTVEADEQSEASSEDEAPKEPEKKKTLRQLLYEENMRLIRVRITNLDPNDKDLTGQIYSVSNEYIGTVTRMVPFGEASEAGWHVPYCILKFLKGMQFLQIKTVGKGSKQRVETNYVRKFAIEELPPLTDKELATLAASQLGRGAIDD